MPTPPNVTDMRGVTYDMIAGAPKNYSPSYGSPGNYGCDQVLAIDDSNNLMVRGQVHTDEGSFRENFSWTTIGISIGTGIVTANSNIITGSGFASLDIHKQDYIKVTADADTFYTQVLFLTDDKITLYTPYTGTGSTTAQALTCALTVPLTGSGGAVAVSGGSCTITSGTTTTTQTGLSRNVDYGPLIYEIKLSRSQMIANNDFYIGLTDTASTNPATARWYARMLFTGTVNTVVTSQTGFNRNTAPSGAEIETNSITLPNSLTTASSNIFRIEQWIDYVKYYINGQIVATHRQSIPRPCDGLQAIAMNLNTGVPTSTTSVVIDYMYVKDLDRVDVGAASVDEYPGTLVRTTLPTAFAPGTIVPWTADTSGRQVVRPYSVPELEWQASSGETALATTTVTALKTAGATGVRNYITGIQLYNNSATVSTLASILDGASTVIWTGYLPATTAALPVVPLNITFPTPLKGTAATAINIRLGTTASSVFYNAQGYQAY